MAQNIINVRLVTRNDTAENWEKSTAVLEVGEFALDTTNGIVKVGDGEHAWKDLGVFNDAKTAAHYEGIANENETDSGVIARVLQNANVEENNKDDIFIVKRKIAENNYSHTAYVYNGTSWAAMDGNYNAENVYFDEDMLFTYAFGKYKLTNGNVTIPSAGKNLKELLMGAHVDIINPTKTAPGFSISASGNISQEVGTTYTLPNATATFTDGKYTYGYVDAQGNKVNGTNTAAGITASKIEVTCDKSSDVKTVNNANTAKLTLTAANLNNADYKDLIVDDTSISYKFTAECSYPASTRTPTNNVGDTSNSETGTTYTPIGSGSWTIDASTQKTATCTVSGWRKMFMGTLSDNTTAIDSEAIRDLSLVSKQAAKTAEEFTVPVGATRIIVAYPKAYTSNAPKFEYFTMSWESFSGFTKIADVKVADARGGENGKVDYTVYVFTHASPTGFEAATKYRVTLQ